MLGSTLLVAAVGVGVVGVVGVVVAAARQVEHLRAVCRQPLCRELQPHDREHVRQGAQVQGRQLLDRARRHCRTSTSNTRARYLAVRSINQAGLLAISLTACACARVWHPLSQRPTLLVVGYLHLAIARQDDQELFQSQYAIGVHGYALVYSCASKASLEIIKVRTRARRWQLDVMSRRDLGDLIVCTQDLNDKLLNAYGADKVP